VNVCSRSSPYSLNCHVGGTVVFRTLCRITQSSKAHRTECQWWITNRQRKWAPKYWTRNSETSFGEITQNNGHYVVQSHSGSTILVPIESLYATSYEYFQLTSCLAPFPRYRGLLDKFSLLTVSASL